MQEEPGLSIAELCRRAYATAVWSRGFHVAVDEKWLPFPTFVMKIVMRLSRAVEADRISELEDKKHWIGRAIEGLGGYVAGDWGRFTDQFETRSVLVVTEMAEACLAHARGDKENLAEELADVMIRIADLAAIEGIDLEAASKAKLEKNALRPYGRGGKKY